MDVEARWIVHQTGDRKGPVSSSIASGGGGEMLSEKLSEGICGLLLKSLTLFKTKICDFLSLFYLGARGDFFVAKLRL